MFYLLSKHKSEFAFSFANEKDNIDIRGNHPKALLQDHSHLFSMHKGVCMAFIICKLFMYGKRDTNVYKTQEYISAQCHWRWPPKGFVCAASSCLRLLPKKTSRTVHFICTW